MLRAATRRYGAHMLLRYASALFLIRYAMLLDLFRRHAIRRYGYDAAAAIRRPPCRRLMSP